MKNLALCVPTYKRADIIERFLHSEIDIINNYDIDLYIFDSSDDDFTQKIVAKYSNSTKINYIRMDSHLSSSEKVFLIYQQFEESDYEYIWMTHDHTEIKEEAFQLILDSLNQKADFYVINLHSSKFSSQVMLDMDEFMVKNAWILNRFGTAIISIPKVIKGTNWRYINGKYLRKKVMNYAHVGYYLERISQITNPRCVLLCVPHEFFYDYTRCEKRSWDYDTIRITTECWGSVISSQSSKYSRKSKRITLMGPGKTEITQYKLIKMKKEKNYSLIICIKYIKWFFRMFYIRDVFIFLLISILPYRLSEFIYNIKIKNIVKREYKKGNKVVIYGAGKFAVECAEKFAKANVDYDGFIVKTMKDNPDILCKHNVYVAEDYVINNNCFIIIAVSRHGMDEVKEYLGNIKTKKNIRFIESGDF